MIHDLSSVRPDGFYARLGLSRGDILLAVNGETLNGPGAMARVLDMFQQEEKLELLLNGVGGTPRHLRVDISPE